MSIHNAKSRRFHESSTRSAAVAAPALSELPPPPSHMVATGGRAGRPPLGPCYLSSRAAIDGTEDRSPTVRPPNAPRAAPATPKNGLPAQAAGCRVSVRAECADRTAQVIIAGLAFLQNLRRGHYAIAAKAPWPLLVAAAFAEVAQAI